MTDGAPTSEAMIAAVVAATMRAPWIGRVLSRLKIEAIDKPDVVAQTDGCRLQFNPERFAAYSDTQQVAIAAHEALHVLFRHSERLSDIRDHGLNNAAADYAINGYLLGKGFDLPPDALYDPQFDGMGAREIRARLFYYSNPWLPPPAWGNVQCDGQSLDNDAEVAQARGDAGGDAGLDAMICREFGVNPQASRLNLEHVLSRLLITEAVWNRDYRRPSRISDDFPAWVEVDEKPRVVVALDISGSIRPEIRETFVGVLARVTTPVTVIAVDTLVRGVWHEVCASNIAKLRDELPARGGGTCFQPALDFAAAARANLVYLTDGDTGENTLAGRGVPVKWLIWGDGARKGVLRPLGQIIEVVT
jgi:predicted metal-dependent peptidase